MCQNIYIYILVHLSSILLKYTLIRNFANLLELSFQNHSKEQKPAMFRCIHVLNILVIFCFILLHAQG